MLFSGLSQHYCYLFFFMLLLVSKRNLSSENLQGIMLYPSGTLVKIQLGTSFQNYSEENFSCKS